MCLIKRIIKKKNKKLNNGRCIHESDTQNTCTLKAWALRELTHSHTHTQKYTRTSQTIKPLVPLHAAALVSVSHQFFLVLRHQMFKTISVSVFERLLYHCDLQKQR